MGYKYSQLHICMITYVTQNGLALFLLFSAPADPYRCWLAIHESMASSLQQLAAACSLGFRYN